MRHAFLLKFADLRPFLTCTLIHYIPIHGHAHTYTYATPVCIHTDTDPFAPLHINTLYTHPWTCTCITHTQRRYVYTLTQTRLLHCTLIHYIPIYITYRLLHCTLIHYIPIHGHAHTYTYATPVCIHTDTDPFAP